MAKKLLVDRIHCKTPTDHTGDDLYFLLMRFDATCKVTRVGPNSAWHDIEKGNVRNQDVVLTSNFNTTYLMAVIDEDDSYDFDTGLMAGMSKILRTLNLAYSAMYKDHGLHLSNMLLAFGDLIKANRSNDDVLWLQPINSAGSLTVYGQGSLYDITLKVA